MEHSRRQVLRWLGGAVACPWLLPAATGTAAAEGTAKRPIRIGQIGVGHAHATKLAVYRESPDYEVVGIVEPDPQLRNQAMAQKVYGDLPWMTEEELLNFPGLEAVLVETRVRDALATAERCVAAGKHIHLDKPAGESLPQFRRILQAAEQQQRMLQMGYMYRYNPAVVLLRTLLERGWLGEVFEVHTVMSKVVDPASRRSLAEYPGGMMFELGCHIIDLTVGVLGEPEKITAYARHGDDALADNMLAVFEYPEALATVKTSAREVEGFARRHFVVCGTEGTFHIQPLDQPSVRLALARPRGDYTRGYQEVRFPRFDRYTADASDMAQVIRGEKTPDFSYAHDLAVQSAVLQVSGLPV